MGIETIEVVDLERSELSDLEIIGVGGKPVGGTIGFKRRSLSVEDDLLIDLALVSTPEVEVEVEDEDKGPEDRFRIASINLGA